jgi:PKD repeat protein
LVNTGTETDTLYLRLIAYGVNDPQHLACADRDSIRVFVYPELDLSFTLDGGLASCQPFISNVNASSNILSGNTYQWYIDDTYYSSQKTPPQLNIENLEDTDVDHVIRFSGESQHGCRDTSLQTITVYSLVDARFTINKAGICSADSFEIDRRTSRGGIVLYEWDWESDGTVDDTRSDSVFNYSFQNTTLPTPVVMPIQLMVYNSHNCPDSITRSISVYPEVHAVFAMDDTTVCYPHQSTFTNSTNNASTFFWDFGDGTGSNNKDPLPHVFENFDNITDEDFTVRLIARSTYNCYDTTDHTITVYAKPDAEFYFPVSVDCPPFEATMVNESEGYNLTYLWDFVDGTSTLENPEHTFSNPGSTIVDIPVTLIVTSGMGCKDTVVRVLNVYPDVVVNFSMSESEGCSPLMVNFNGQATNVTNMLWYIDGLAFSTLEDPSYRFQNNTPNTREYEVTFSAHSLHGCSDDTTQIVTVYSTPTAEFIPEPINQDYNTDEDRTLVTFFNESLFQNNWSYFWDYGDGNTDNNGAASFDYYYGENFWGPGSENGRIPVYLVAWNTDRPECRDTVQYDIYIKAPLPEIELEEDVSGCEPFTVDFSATVDYAFEDQYEWDFGVPGATSTESNPSYTYDSAGVYTVRLEVHGDGGTNWDYRIITVNPKPEINFTFNDSIVFVRSQNHPNEIINFYNLTAYGQNYYWGFNLPAYDYSLIPNYVDTASTAYSTEKDPSWFYDRTGIYYVFLIAESDQTCSDTMIHPIAIYVQGEGRLQFPTGFFVDPSAPRDEYIADPEDPSRNIFRAYGQGIAEFKLEVYNRWGVLVFESHDINHGWNGFLDGKPAKQDVYVWRAKGRFTNGEPFEMSGDVTLIVAPDIGQVH